MDEGRWLASEKLSELVAHLRETAGVHRKKAGRRKLRLLTCAHARTTWEQLSGPSRALVEAIELLADGRLTEQEFEARVAEIHAAASKEGVRLGTGADAIWGYLLVTTDLGYVPVATASFVGMRLAYAARVEAQAAGNAAPQIDDAVRRVSQASNRRACDLAREIFGNPSRPLPPRKFPAELRGLAQSCFDDAAHYPLLADALADLGEEEAAAHCRLPDHVKGCHVVDWILGRQ